MIINWDETKDVFPKVETDEIITKAHKNNISEWLEKFQDLHGYGIRAGFDTLKDRLADFYNHGVRYMQGYAILSENETKYVLNEKLLSTSGYDVIIIQDPGEVTELRIKASGTLGAGSQYRVELWKNKNGTGLYNFINPEDETNVKVMTAGHFNVQPNDILQFEVKETKGVPPGVKIDMSAKIVNT